MTQEGEHRRSGMRDHEGRSSSYQGNRERELITLIYVHVEMGALVRCVCKYLS